MSPVLRIAAYVGLAVVGFTFGQRALDAYGQRMTQAERRFDTVDTIGAATSTAPGEAASGGLTNAALPATTNAPTPPGTNAATVSSAEIPGPAGTGSGAPSAARGTTPSQLGLYAALTLGAVLLLALMLGQDLSHWVAQRAHRELFNEEGEGVADPEYERAEQVWAQGDHLEAVRLFREYLSKRPRQIHVALRIAEIYENDLHNPLAAALEYEEILKHRLEAERWGWAAIHLCNLYYRLEQAPKADQVLRRIVREYGQTAAAKKARERLGLAEGDVPPAEEAEAAAAGDGDEAGFKLPPGFRPKRG
ncbi:MAG: hypothetical protein FJ387_20320 [Verrucomicrobia bacterium]|nr:hypothetical protein [Verrucomicrobiota bacterium]